MLKNRFILLATLLIFSCGGPTSTNVEVTTAAPDNVKTNSPSMGGTSGRAGVKDTQPGGSGATPFDAAIPIANVDAGLTPVQDAAPMVDAATPPPKLDTATPPPKLDAAAPKLDAAAPPLPKEVAALGTAFRWWQLTSEAGADNQSAMTELNDGDANTGRSLADQDDEVAAWEAGGVIWNSPLAEITQVDWTNGEWDADRNGAFTANIKLQISLDGVAWTDAPGFSMSPDYAFDTVNVSKAKYTFTGHATNVRGVRVIGQVRTGSDPLSFRAAANELSVLGR